jgi:cell division protein FtsW (lipid II flippase)
MSITYVPAASRERRRTFVGVTDVGETYVLLLATTLLAGVAIALAVGGRLAVVATSTAAAPVHLNGDLTADALETALLPALPAQADRRLAMASIRAHVEHAQQQGTSIRHVAELLNASIPSEAIDAAPDAVSYRTRLAQAREAAAARAVPPPAALGALSTTEFVAVKRGFVVRTPEEFRRAVGWSALLYLASAWFVACVWSVRRVHGDAVLLCAGHFLIGIGFAVLVSRPDPLRDVVLVQRYAVSVACGMAMWAAMSTLRVQNMLHGFSYLPLLGALALSVLLILFGHGPGSSGAKVNLGPVQPIEAIRLLMALFLAGYFAHRWELLRQIHADTVGRFALPSWVRLPRPEYVLPVVVGIAAALTLFFVQKDLGPALLLACVFLAMYAVARGRAAMATAGLLVLVAGFYVGYRLNVSSALASRVAMWTSPWDNVVRGGDQVAQATWAFSSGGLVGTGLGLGDTRYLPAGHTDLALAAIGEELGFVGLLLVATVYAVLIARGLKIALRAHNDYAFFLALALTLFVAMPVLVMAAGVVGAIPLTGVVTPFLSYGGSAMVANCAAMGILTSLAHRFGASTATTPFRLPVRALGGAAAVATVALLAMAFNVQIVAADDAVVRPHLGVQADGARRYQYNPRVLDVAAFVPRGTVFDRTGLPLATNDARLLARMRDRYAKAQVPVSATCDVAGERCYPLDGAAVHVLGDARTRRHWTATNTSYVERDLEARLRGFDDHETVVSVPDAAASRMIPAVKRDYRELVPLLRHRRDPGHPAVQALMGRERDVSLTLDARLQWRVAQILSAYSTRSTHGRAAAVVIDPDTGDILASVSYPMPRLVTASPTAADREAEAWLDRARFGLYPPGSTFKLVTAIAATRRHVRGDNTTFMCRLLPDGRIGASLPRWGTVRDDVLDTHAHGTLDLHGGLVRSCNAYFAQLALHLGPDALIDTAERLGISLAPKQSRARVAATLPHAGYGQGDVVTTPLRMARVAGAIAARGVLRDNRIVASATPSGSTALLAPAAASALARSMREAVLSGTGRALRAHPVAVAGKTGTAEVSQARSHSWFVGFAPHGSAKRRIAFAVIVEHAGYGSLAAAPAAGDIVRAAAEIGLIQ